MPHSCRPTVISTLLNLDRAFFAPRSHNDRFYRDDVRFFDLDDKVGARSTSNSTTMSSDTGRVFVRRRCLRIAQEQPNPETAVPPSPTTAKGAPEKATAGVLTFLSEKTGDPHGASALNETILSRVCNKQFPERALLASTAQQSCLLIPIAT